MRDDEPNTRGAGDVYDSIAGEFDRSRGTAPWKALVDFLSLMEIKNGTIFCPSTLSLDAGCGNGRNAPLLAGPTGAGRCIGFDISAGLLARAREHFSRDPRLGWVQASILAIPFREKKFDLVGCIAAVHHLLGRKKILAALSELARCLVPCNGRVLVSVWWKWQKRFRRRVLVNYLSFKRTPEFVPVPWNSRDGEAVEMRSYYLISRGELVRVMKRSFTVLSTRMLGGPGGRDNVFVLGKAP
jgi:SAM-dependent methyltransferase